MRYEEEEGIMATLREYYHLRRDTFSIDPKNDPDAYFGRDELADRIKTRIESDFLEQRAVPKLLLHGQYGAGKTHSLFFIKYLLETNERWRRIFPKTMPITLELGPLKKKERWVTVHRHLVDSVGLVRLKAAASALLSRGGDASPVELLRESGALRFGEAAIRDSQAQIFRNLLFGGRQETLSWEWLKGQKLSVDDSIMLGTETNLTEPSDLIAALLNIGSLFWQGLGEKIVFQVDEGEALRSITNPDSIDEFNYAIRRLAEDDNDVIGLIVAYQSEGGMEATPPMFEDEAVRRRLGYEPAYIDLEGLVAGPEDARGFVLDVLKYLVDQDAAKDTIEREGLDVDPAYFPFTPETVDRIADFVTEEPERKLPSQIITRLKHAVNQGWREGEGADGHVLIDDSILEPVLYPEEV
jgi:hypothetical protein